MRTLIFLLFMTALQVNMNAQYEEGTNPTFTAVEFGPEASLPPAPTYVSIRPRDTDGDPAPEIKTYITADIFPKAPSAGDQVWIEYGLPLGAIVAVELFDPAGFSYILVSGGREAGVVVDALTIPAHLKPGTYFLKIKARNGRCVLPITIQ